MPWDKNKVLLNEMLSNETGKTSASGTIGVFAGFIAGFSFIATMLGWFFGIPNATDVMQIVLQLFGISALLLGARKVSGRFGNSGSPPDDSGDSEAKTGSEGSETQK